MLANLPKRRIADPWSLEITTSPAPGEGSVAEDTMEYAKAVFEGRASDSRFFFFHRQATDGAHDLETPAGVRDAVLEASGPVAGWSDIDGIADQWKDPTADRAYLQRVWLNQPVRAAERAFDVVRWDELAKVGHVIPLKAVVTLGFDGAKYHDATALVATDILRGFQALIGCWEKPFVDEKAGRPWQVPEADVAQVLDAAFQRWNVWRLYADPPYWETTVAGWAGKYGEERVVSWSTSRTRKMAECLRGYTNAQKDGHLSHDGNPIFRRHLGNSFRKATPFVDENGERMWTIQKERSGSPNKIDVAMAGALSWEARRDALIEGVGVKKPSVYETRAPVTL
jgi:hypothetical protein